mmetsp:Transcript_46587/g.110973  ORF Transcript_46587/g.110973 Transcript_46587/m.110973 type:complete len:350 (-) Transcript_46587:333-1382(-)
MVGRRPGSRHQSHLPPHLRGRLADDADEAPRLGHGRAARAREKQPAGLHAPDRGLVELLVLGRRAVEVLAGGGELGGVEDDDVPLLALAQRREQEPVDLLLVGPDLDAVDLRVVLRQRDRVGGRVDALDGLRPRQHRRHAEAARVAEGVKHVLALAEPRERVPVVALVQVVPGLVPEARGHGKLDPVLLDNRGVSEPGVHEPRFLRIGLRSGLRSAVILLGPLGRLVLLLGVLLDLLARRDALRARRDHEAVLAEAVGRLAPDHLEVRHHLRERRQDLSLGDFEPPGRGRQHRGVRVDVDHQPRDAIALPVHQAVGGSLLGRELEARPHALGHLEPLLQHRCQVRGVGR